MESQFLIAMPPHQQSIVLSEIATILGKTEAEANLQIKYAAPAIWAYSTTGDSLSEMARSLQAQGVHCAVTAVETVFGLPEPHEATDFELTSSAICLETTAGVISFDLNAPLLFVEQKPLQAGGEFQKLRQKKEARKDKKKRAGRNTHAILASALEEDAERGNAHYRWIFTQPEAESRVKRACVQTSKLPFDCLKDDMALHSSENIRRLRERIITLAAAITHQDGLVNIPYRYPMLFDPSFVQIMDRYAISRASLTPDRLADRVSAASWIASRRQ